MKELVTFGNILLISLGITLVAIVFLYVSESIFKKTVPKLLIKSMGLAFVMFLLIGTALEIYIILLAWLPLGWWIIAGTAALTLLIAIGTVIIGIKFEDEEWECLTRLKIESKRD